MIEAFGISHVGMVRSINEDSFVVDEEAGLYVVADGMGGAQAGETASHIAVQTLAEAMNGEARSPSADDLATAIRNANLNIRQEAEAHPEFSGMGTTVVAAALHEHSMVVANVGDSRAYLHTGGELYCVTTDHTWVNEVGRGLGLTDEQIRTHPYRNVLTKAVGAEDQVQVDVQEITFQPGDTLLMCSDGLHNVAGEQALLNALEGAGTLEQKCQVLIDAALEHGGPDNVTVVLIHKT